MLGKVIIYLAALGGIVAAIYASIEHNERIIKERFQIEIQSLQANLERERQENAKLRSEVERLQKELETKQSQLDKEQVEKRRIQSSNQMLEKDRDQLQRMVDERPPPLLRVTIGTSGAPGKFLVIVNNPSQSVIRVIQHEGQSWLNGRPGKTTNKSHTVVISPGITDYFFTYTISGDNLMPLREGKADFRAAICLVYETVSGIDRRRWLTERWFKYQPDCPNGLCVRFSKQDDRILKNPSDGCNMERLMPPGWLDIKN